MYVHEPIFSSIFSATINFEEQNNKFSKKEINPNLSPQYVLAKLNNINFAK